MKLIDGEMLFIADLDKVVEYPTFLQNWDSKLFLVGGKVADSRTGQRYDVCPIPENGDILVSKFDGTVFTPCRVDFELKVVTCYSTGFSGQVISFSSLSGYLNLTRTCERL